MNSKLLNDIIGWDTINWGKSIDFFEENIDFSNMQNALEIGAGNWGGYSLYFASKNIKTICSNPLGDFHNVKKIHEAYPFAKKIKYEKIDALNIGYQNKFDCIGFKSVMGILGEKNTDRFANLDVQKKMITQVSKALKKGGHLIFADNLKGSKFHQFVNNKFGWGKNNKGWRYFSIDEYIEIIGDEFELVNYATAGVFGLIGKKEKLKKIIGTLDSFFFNRLVNENSRYIIFCVFRKK
tara:strand:+ start:104 stop:817 length:714 start_codon:yes stop_codon:yes gene_type:complete